MPTQRPVCLIATLLLPAVLSAQQLDTASTLAGLRAAAQACTLDASKLWGASLCGPIAMVDPATRLTITNDTAPGRPFVAFGDAFITTIPSSQLLASTSFTWGNRRWAMVLLPLPTDQFDRASGVIHEAFHREQRALKLEGSDPPNNQLDVLQGRHLFRLELRAYADALDALVKDTVRVRQYALDAMLFRARRHELYPAADSLERQLEMQEGIAEYTGDRLAMALTGVNATRIATRLRKYESNPTYVRSFAYATGPALGLLLDRFAPDWRTELHVTPDPARLLATAIRFHTPKDIASAVRDRSKNYGDSEIMMQELARDSTRKVRTADYQRRLLDGPTVTLHQTNLSRSFNPQMLVGFDSTWTVYPTGSFKDKWGSLEVKEGGALVANDFRTIRIEAPQGLAAGNAQTINGPGWTLNLAQGWSLKPVIGRSGSYEVTSTQ